jgi:predicted RNA-binding protein with TRAM domain
MKWRRLQSGARSRHGLVEDGEIAEVDGDTFAEHGVGRARIA